MGHISRPAVDQRSLRRRAGGLQSGQSPDAHAALLHALLRHQQMARLAHRLDQQFCLKWCNDIPLYNLCLDPGLLQAGRRLQKVVDLHAIARQGDVCPMAEDHGGGIPRICLEGPLSSSGIAYRHGTGVAAHCRLQHPVQFCEIGGGIHRDPRNAVQIGHVEYPVMGLSIIPH